MYTNVKEEAWRLGVGKGMKAGGDVNLRNLSVGNLHLFYLPDPHPVGGEKIPLLIKSDDSTFTNPKRGPRALFGLSSPRLQFQYFQAQAESPLLTQAWEQTQY